MLRCCLLFLSVLLLGACQSLPPLSERTASTHLPQPAHSRLQHILRSQSATPPEQADVYVLDDAHDAFAARAALIDHADAALDIQYYIWRNDTSGKLLMDKLLYAADRGVRVRLLLDDNNTRGSDAYWAALDQHSNIEVRLFNPFTNRNWRALGYLGDFPRLNRRMHNKALIADNHSAVIGGRNIGDEYFNVSPDTAFSDMDVLIKGKQVQELSRDFDRYWNSDSAYPFHAIAPHTEAEPALQDLNAPITSSTPYQIYHGKQAAAPLLQAIRRQNIPFTSANIKLINDDPAKALDRHSQTDILQHLQDALQTPTQEVYLVSPYFVPTHYGLEALKQLRQNGVAITVLTNSLRATDVSAVHSGYARYRKAMLQQSIDLYELKADHTAPAGKDKGLTGSITNSLHAKTFIIDKQRIFIGSLNLDPRSAKLNTEMGVVIYSPDLAQQMENKLRRSAAETAYRVSLNPQGRLQWRNPHSGENEQQEPDAGFWKRWASRLFSILPIERLL